MVSPTFFAEYSTDVVLRDGTTLHIRPVRPDDDSKLLDLFQRMSEQSLYYRFLSVPKLDLHQVAKLAQVDYEQQFVMVGECGLPLAAVAGYYRSDRDPGHAEVAFAIPDALQGRGIGTRMLERLAEIARERGLHAFDAYVLGENRKMMDVFLESGFEVSQELEHGVFHVALLLEPTEAFTERSAERSQKAASASMRSFFEPKVVAVVGASRDPGRMGSVTLRNLRDTGFTGTLVPVHPEAGVIDGLQAYPTVAAIPDPAYPLNATFSPVYPPPGRVAFSTQSGALGLAILDYVKKLNLGISTFASIGNKADVSGNDLIQYWANDDRTDVILLYLESFGNPKKFGQIARRVGRGKPIVAVKAGRSTAGARAASSHTGARATSDALVDTLLRQAGVIRTHTLEELFDVASLLAHQPVPLGRNVAIITNAGGPGILAADACEANGLNLPTLSPGTVAALRTFLPASASVANPVDMIASATPEQYRRAIELLLSDANVDSLLVIFIPPLVNAAEDVGAAIRTAVAGNTSKPVLATFMGMQGPMPLSSVPSYLFPESAAVALARVTHYGEWLRKPVGSVLPADRFDRDGARAIVATALAVGGGWLGPADAQALLKTCGIAVAETRLARTPDEAARAAAEIGFPVAMKAVGATLLHKTEIGGVRLGVSGEHAVREAYADFAARLGDRLEAVLVQRMIAGGVEMVVGGINDPSFGPLVMSGTGGIFVELVGDTVFRMCPLTDTDATEMINEMKGKVLLRGYRGSAPSDEAAFHNVLLSVSQLMDACPEILEMDINPVLVLARGAVAADVRIMIGPKATGPAGRRISY